MISIIVPVYNSQNYLDRCISSILDQTYTDFELIIVDDGSTDDSLRICMKYAQIDKRVVVISQKNTGAGLARNAGLAIAKGDYIGFVDSDDYISHDMYEKMYQAAITKDADIVQCGYYKVDMEDNVISTSRYINVISTNNESSFKEYCKKKNIDNYSPCKIFRKQIISGVFFGNYKYSEDAYFIIQAFLNCTNLVVIPTPLYYYVQTPNSTCRKPFNKEYEDTITVGEYMYNITHKKFPHLAFYFARYTAIWVRVNYLGVLNNFYNKSTLDSYYEKFKIYFKRSKIYVPYSVETMLLFIFRISPKLYILVKKNIFKS